jgi:hypothetical protein
MFYHLTPWQSWEVVLFYSYEYQRIQTKNSFDKILSLNFNLRILKVKIYLIMLD